MIYYPAFVGKAGVAQWQSSSLPSWLRGFDSLRPLQTDSSQGGVMAAAADSKSAIREYVRVRVPLLAPAFAPTELWLAGLAMRTDRKRLEGCPSGRWCNLGKVVWGQLHRGFESPPLRQLLKTEVFEMAATRRQAREWAIQMLTAADLNPPDDVQRFMATFWETVASLDEQDGPAAAPKKALMEFSEERVRGVLEKKDEIDRILVPLLENWDLYRLGTVERAVLRMGIWEMTWSDVPKPVVINEAIDLANWFSTPKSRTLVNAVLDRYAKAGDRG